MMILLIGFAAIITFLFVWFIMAVGAGAEADTDRMAGWDGAGRGQGGRSWK